MFANVWTRTGLWERADKEWLVKAGAVFGPIRWEAYFGYGEVTVAVGVGGNPPCSRLFCQKEGGAGSDGNSSRPVSI